MDEDVGGFLFGRLLQRAPHAQADLLAFRQHLMAAASRDEPIKVLPHTLTNSLKSTNYVFVDLAYLVLQSARAQIPNLSMPIDVCR